MTFLSGVSGRCGNPPRAGARFGPGLVEQLTIYTQDKTAAPAVTPPSAPGTGAGTRHGGLPERRPWRGNPAAIGVSRFAEHEQMARVDGLRPIVRPTAREGQRASDELSHSDAITPPLDSPEDRAGPSSGRLLAADRSPGATASTTKQLEAPSAAFPQRSSETYGTGALELALSPARDSDAAWPPSAALREKERSRQGHGTRDAYDGGVSGRELQRYWASATASGPAGKRSWPVSSFAARQIASATWDGCVTTVGCWKSAMTRSAKAV